MLLDDTPTIGRITARDLLLGVEDIRDFASKLALEVSDSQAEEIHDRTEGWAVAVALYLQNLKTGNDVTDVRDTDTLIYQLFWKKAPNRLQEVMLRLCLFEELAADQIRQVLPAPEGEPQELPYNLWESVPLLAYFPQRRQYFPHEILLTFLRRQLRQTDEGFRRECYQRAGCWYRDHGQGREAVSAFYAVGDYEGVLSCPLTGLLMEQISGVSYTQVARTVLRDCPEEIQQRYPISVLRLCYALFAGADFATYELMLERARRRIEAGGDQAMLGEWHMVAALREFPDVAQMEAHYRQAEELLQGPSQVFTYQEPFLFGCTSMWYLFFSKPGQMMAIADQLEEMMAIYNRITGDHGAGAAELYRGEALCVQGRYDEAEIFALRAALLSEQGQNASVTYGAALLLGINAIYQTDMLALQKALEYLEEKAQGYPFLQGTAINRCMVETVRGYLLALMMETDRSAQWTQGMRNREIAAQLHVSEETVKAHLKSIFQKLNIDRRSRLVELLK